MQQKTGKSAEKEVEMQLAAGGKQKKAYQKASGEQPEEEVGEKQQYFAAKKAQRQEYIVEKAGHNAAKQHKGGLRVLIYAGKHNINSLKRSVSKCRAQGQEEYCGRCTRRR